MEEPQSVSEEIVDSEQSDDESEPVQTRESMNKFIEEMFKLNVSSSSSTQNDRGDSISFNHL